MELTISELEDRFLDSLKNYRQAPDFNREEKKKKLLSQADQLARTFDGLAALYQHTPDLVEAGIFDQTVWVDPQHLYAPLVSGTLLAGYPTATVELLSELRILAVSENKLELPHYTSAQAKSFLEDLLAANLELAFEDFSSEAWESYTRGELKKIRLLFDLLLKHIPLKSLNKRLSDEVTTMAAHRPIVTSKIESLLTIIDEKIILEKNDSASEQLSIYLDALLHPTKAATKHQSLDTYREFVRQATPQQLDREGQQMGKLMTETGLVSIYHVELLRFIANHAPNLIPKTLNLDNHGKVEYERHQELVLQLIDQFIVPATKQAVYGLARVLQRNLFSQKITLHALNRLIQIRIMPRVARRLEKGNQTSYQASPKQLMVGGTLCLLGRPLGIRQGNNPTCQSARGLSMWSRHAPGKLINLLIDACTADNLVFRYEGLLIESADTVKGLVRKFDYKLDPVSIVLVPHLDKVYNEMMRQAAVKLLGEDPHISVNPAFYGHWIQTGFFSVYNTITAAIDDYENFIRVFYASFHPQYNGGHQLIYPVPLGIFITDASGGMLGYHAISLLRVEKSPQDEWRVYFFNPNVAGVQNWGQDIRPSVRGHGEIPGESSLPMDQFTSRVYAFHYNQLQLGDKHKKIPAAIVQKITSLAKESWGRKYVWTN